MEGEVAEFVVKDSQLNTGTYATTKGGASLSFLDLVALSKAVVTEQSKTFFATLLSENTILDSQPDETMVLASMHSGSSDYLMLGDVRAIANYELPNA